MKLFDEDGNYIGEFIEKTEETVDSAFKISWLLGIICFLISPVWTIIVILICSIIKLFFKLIVLILRVIWWIIKLPFCLIFFRKLPIF